MINSFPVKYLTPIFLILAFRVVLFTEIGRYHLVTRPHHWFNHLMERDDQPTPCFGEDEKRADTIAHDFIIIPLGCNCHPSFNTRIFGVRTFAFPFDWCFTPYESLRNLLSSDFKDFFKKENLIPSRKVSFKEFVLKFADEQSIADKCEADGWVLDREHGIIFLHDFANSQQETIYREHIRINDKYKRRIKRFYQEINSGKHVYFIRFHDITKSQSLELLDLLKNKFPNTKFTLIVIGNSDEFKINWAIPNLKNFFGATHEDFNWESLCVGIKDQTLDIN